jgi:hypothetical protein
VPEPVEATNVHAFQVVARTVQPAIAPAKATMRRSRKPPRARPAARDTAIASLYSGRRANIEFICAPRHFGGMSNWFTNYHQALQLRALSLIVVFGALCPGLGLLVLAGRRLTGRLTRRAGFGAATSWEVVS